MLSEDEYVSLVADALEMLAPEQIVMRLIAEGTKDEIVAPAWALDKTPVIERINQELIKRDTRQGSRYSAKRI